MTIGGRLREERERLDLSQTSMAEAAGTTKKTQLDYEKNRTPPKANYLAKVATFGVDVAYVITGIRAENVAHNAIELGYLRQCRILATKGLAQQGLDGLNFLRISNVIEWSDMPAVYQSMQTGGVE
ncbi:MAG: helix-turn-helix transcriptional regulator [Methylobacter tundripaludum]|nr:helix-turn-helix transcriptional regulator [Methylobacter tundripaludum]